MAATRRSPKGKTVAKPMAMPTSERQSLRIEKIENGYLAHHSNDGPKGYETKTVFHPEKPVVTLAATPAATPAAPSMKKGVKK